MLPIDFGSIDALVKKPEMEQMSPTTDLNEDSAQADHLAVLIHGLWGSPSHLWYLSSSLREKFPDDKLHILVAKKNSGSFTYDGIELGGERVAQEIEETLDELARKGQNVKKISIVGYSLGGLVARYAIGLLYHKGLFDKVEPVNFTTFASPHLGVRTPLLGIHNHLWNVLGARLLSMSGRQLFTIDSFRDTGRPLLSVLADPDSIFIKALAKFKQRSLYSNIVNDRSAVYYTTGISRTDPFVDMDAINVNYIKDYAPVILDADNPVSPKEQEPVPTALQRVAKSTSVIAGSIPIAAFLALFMTIGVPLFMLTSVVQSFRSSRRIRLHQEGKAGIDASQYQIPLLRSLAADVRQTAEDIFENINQSQSQEYLPAGSEEWELENGELPSPVMSPKHKFSRSMSSLSEKPLLETEAEGEASGSSAVEMPTLALTPSQFAMIQALDDVGFKKYPVWIHEARHSHAAIILRMNRAAFHEGKVVVKHWLNEFEI